MRDNEDTGPTITLSGAHQEQAVCPFSKGLWKKAGDALVLFMLFVTPILFLVALFMTRLY